MNQKKIIGTQKGLMTMIEEVTESIELVNDIDSQIKKLQAEKRRLKKAAETAVNKNLLDYEWLKSCDIKLECAWSEYSTPYLLAIPHNFPLAEVKGSTITKDTVNKVEIRKSGKNFTIQASYSVKNPKTTLVKLIKKYDIKIPKPRISVDNKKWIEFLTELMSTKGMKE
jgi:hypothetical protein